MTGEEQDWVSVPALAACVGVSRRAMLKAALLAKGAGRPWRGMALEVETSSGRGGRSGLTYKVSVSSLSEPYKTALTGTSSALVPLLKSPDFKQRLIRDRSRSERQAAIAEAVNFAPGSPERRAAMTAAALASGKSEKTIGRWCAAYDAGGLTGLGRAKPKTTGERRYFVSAVFDKAFLAAGYPSEELLAISRDVEQFIKGLWITREADSGWADLNRLAEYLLEKRCQELGFPLPHSAVRIGRHAVERYRPYSIVNLKRNNAKAYQDQLPGVSRDWTPLPPMECVVADVKHLDVLVKREDGTTAWPKMVAFMDSGVGRVFHYLVLCEQKRSIRQEHVIKAFIAMATHPDWGFPSTLYLDNGSEFGGLDLIEPALALLDNGYGRQIIHAKAYSAKSKPIEPLFRRLDEKCFASIPGYAGGDRQKKKTQNIGREPEPFTGTWDDFVAVVNGLIKYYHGIPIGGLWNNKSPNDVLRSKVAAGWEPIMPDYFKLDAAFHKHSWAKIKRGIISTPRGKFHHPDLLAVPAGTDVEILTPYRAADAPIARIPGTEAAFRLLPETIYDARDIEGARESSRRQAAANRAVRAMETEVPAYDPVAIKMSIAAEQLPVIIPGRRERMDHGTTLNDLGQVLQLVDQRTDVASESQPSDDARRERALKRLAKGKARAAA